MLGRTAKTLTVVLLVGIVCTGSWVVANRAQAMPYASVSNRLDQEHGMRADTFAPSVHSSEVMTAYLPLVGRNFPSPPPQFGVVMLGINESQGLSYAVEGGAHWVRENDAFHWDRIEPVNTGPSGYDWDAVRESSLRNAAENGLEVIAGVKFTPAWAQKVDGWYCGPIKRENFGDYAEFLAAMVERYGPSTEYGVRYFELGNEPDVDPSLVPERNPFGCWGDKDDPYYGGGYYAEMLKVVYPAMKQADPRVQVVIGGLLLDCHPEDPQCSNPRPARFLEGILVNGGGNYFDVVSFHGYPGRTLQQDMNFPTWDEQGGVVLGKIAFIREVMDTYGVDKPILHTEGALGWGCSPLDATCPEPNDSFYEAQADYVVWLFVRNWAQDLLGTTWFQFSGMGRLGYNGMLDADGEPRPAYYAFDFLTDELGEASYVGKVAGAPAALEAHAFLAPDKRIWVLWAPDEQPRRLELPGSVTAVYDKYGTPLEVGSYLDISHPVYVELTP